MHSYLPAGFPGTSTQSKHDDPTLQSKVFQWTREHIYEVQWQLSYPVSVINLNDTQSQYHTRWEEVCVY